MGPSEKQPPLSPGSPTVHQLSSAQLTPVLDNKGLLYLFITQEEVSIKESELSPQQQRWPTAQPGVRTGRGKGGLPGCAAVKKAGRHLILCSPGEHAHLTQKDSKEAPPSGKRSISHGGKGCTNVLCLCDHRGIKYLKTD